MIKVLHCFALGLAICLLHACSSTPTNLAPNSINIPNKSYFVDYYQQDLEHQKVLSKKDYLTWVHRFYFGWPLYPRGWIKATEELTQPLPIEQQAKARKKMSSIGNLVAPEWAKNKAFRVINTRHLSIWGNSIRNSSAKGMQLILLESILLDVNALLNGSLQPSDISYKRYNSGMTFDPFAEQNIAPNF